MESTTPDESADLRENLLNKAAAVPAAGTMTTSPEDDTTSPPLVGTMTRRGSNGGRRFTVRVSRLQLAMSLFLATLLLIILLLLVFVVTRIAYSCQQWPIQGSNISLVWSQCIQFSRIHNLCEFQRGYPDIKCSPSTDPPQLPKELIRDIRLTMHFTPQLYRIRLQTHIHENDSRLFHFNGSVSIAVHCFNDTDNFQIHAFMLTVREELIWVRLLNGGSESTTQVMNVTSLWVDSTRQWLNITLNDTMRAGYTYEIVMDQFRANLSSTHLAGLYLSSYVENGVERFLATSQMQPTDARRVFPCFDEPALKAKFHVTIVRHREFHSITNMELIESRLVDETWVEDEHKTSIVMPTYLLGFVVSKFKNLTLYDRKGRRFSVWARPDMIDSANYSLQIGVQILEFFEEFFEMPYPLNKTDMVAVPDFQAGAMENWGVIIYREGAMLWDPDKSSEEVRQKVAVVVSHEIAHQWFGNLVTLKWWDDLWLNEGFASFVEYLGVNMVYPEWFMDDQFVAVEMLTVMMVDSAPSTHPVQMPVYNPDEIGSIFDYISYNKGASLIRMMEQFLGVDVFRKGLKSYLSKHKYGNTIYDDLWAVLQETAKQEGRSIDLKSIMDKWIQQAGYPMVLVQRINKTTLQLSQSRFTLRSQDNFNQTGNERLWSIPITYTYESKQSWNGTNQVFWMEQETAEMELEPSISGEDWYVVNLRRGGFYRVNYDLENWDRLIKQLKENHTVIPPLQRAALLDDLFNMAGQGLVNFTYFMRLARYLKEEKEFVPWHAASKFISYMDALLSTQPYYGYFQEYVKELGEPIYQSLGWEKKDDDSHLVKMLRPMIINMMCHIGHDECSKEAIDRFKEWKRNTSSITISGDLKSVIFCQGIKYGDNGDWNFLFNQTKFIRTSHEMSFILRGLGCSRDPWILKKYLNIMLFSKRFNLPEASDVAIGILRNPLGEFIIWDFLSQYPQNVTNAAISVISNSFHASSHLVKTKDHVDKLVDLRTSLKQSLQPGNYRILDTILETGKQNVFWMDRYSATVAEWLGEQYGTR